MGIHCARVYKAATPMRQVLDDLLERLNTDLQGLLGTELENLWYVPQPLYWVILFNKIFKVSNHPVRP